MGLTTPEVEFIAFSSEGVITRETWVASRLHCPRCGHGAGAVWVNMSEPVLKVGQIATRIFLCLECGLVAIGLNGFEPSWDKAERVQQIVKHGFTPDPAAAARDAEHAELLDNLIVGVDI